MIKILALITLILLTGCSTTKTNDQVANEKQAAERANTRVIYDKIREREKALNEFNKKQIKKYQKQYEVEFNKGF